MRVLPAQAQLALPKPIPITDRPASRLIEAATTLLAHLEVGRALDAALLRQAMREAFGADDSEGTWVWKDAYEACEVTQLLFLRRHLAAMRKRAGSNAQLLAMLGKLTALTPTHTRRSEESQQLQQFSTPLEPAFVACLAAGITAEDCVLEPSAGTGQLAVFAEASSAQLVLNELAAARADLLSELFPRTPVTRFNAEQIDDHLDPAIAPSVVLMNPPFSASPHIKGTAPGVALRHIKSALQRLRPGGRLVTITGANLVPSDVAFTEALRSVEPTARCVFTCAIAGGVYRRHGTTVDTRLTVIDRAEAELPTVALLLAESAEELLAQVLALVPPRQALTPAIPAKERPVPRMLPIPPAACPRQAAAPMAATSIETPPAAELVYTRREVSRQAAHLSDALYEPYRVESIAIEGARPHPTRLVQSAAMASVRPPVPSYRPHLPPAIVTESLLSDAQLETVVYAGEAHSGHLAGHWTLNDSLDVIALAKPDLPGAVRFRRGWFLGDGTGAGKGRQIAGILLDNWLKGRRRALWISKSDKLIEDAQRDWSALGQEKLLIVPLDRFAQGKPIRLAEGILFVTYATLRSPERDGKPSRLQQILDWLGTTFDGVIVFDEAHAMANAAGGSSERGERAPSQQGLAGLKLQHALADARVVYVSATGATTVQNLAYAQRLGLWGGDDFPFASRPDFVAAMEEGGIASMEVLARDLKALGLYTSRSLSYEGVEVDILEHALTPGQTRIYDSYAAAFQVIHHNLDAALKAANVTGDESTLNKQAKAAARSAFESNKQRFFNHLITAMKMPTLIRAIEADLAAGHAAVVQLVSTSEALMERRLAQIPAAEWGDLSIDVTPREYVLDYLASGFPTQLYETYTNEEGHLLSRPVLVEGNPVHSREAQERRERMIEHLAALPPVQSALDQLIQRFGTDAVAEVTGRSRRIVRRQRLGASVLAVETRPASANLAETQAFMEGRKPILVFSDAGGTGRSYHADLACQNQRLRVHYLLEAGWKADTAIQGLGRTNRTNQKQPPLFRPVATDVRGEKRFLSTIARRLDSLGAITRGQRQTGGQGLFRPEDNLESRYARAALRQLYLLLYKGALPGCSLARFTEATGLELVDGDGTLREKLPPITTFLNRLLALEIGLQNTLFETFDALLSAQVESAIASGTYEIGLETIQAESLRIVGRRSIATHAATGAETLLLEIERKDRNEPLNLAAALELAGTGGGTLMVNTASKRAAVRLPAPGWTLEDGSVEPRVRLVRPMERTTLATAALADSHWIKAKPETFSRLWSSELASIPEFTTSRFHLVAGLLLPVWKRLPLDNPRVYRFETDDKERVIGRRVPPDCLDALGVSANSALTPEDAFAALLQGRPLALAGGRALRRVTVMHVSRIELTGFDAEEVELLKARGLISEIISWKLRLFVPTGEEGPRVLAQLLERHPPVASAECPAASGPES